MSVSRFAKEISPKFPIGGLIDCSVQEVSLLIGDVGCELNGRMYTVEECYETIKGCSAILSQHKDKKKNYFTYTTYHFCATMQFVFYFASELFLGRGERAYSFIKNVISVVLGRGLARAWHMQYEFP